MKNMLLRRRIMLGLASSPFSPEATAILKEDFPDYWEDIKAYGYANPQMVSWINEDPHLVCSLLDVGKVRWLVGDGASYITGIYSSDNGFISKIRFRRTIGTFDREAFFGKYPTSGVYYSRNGLIIQYDSNSGKYYFNLQAGELYGIRTEFSILENTVYDVEASTKDSAYIKVNGNTIFSQSTSRHSASDTDMPIFNDTNTNRAIHYIQISQLELYTGINDDLLVTLVPFVSSTRNGVLDIHDLSNPTFYPNVGTGTFTTAEQYYPYGEILPSTKASIIEDYGEDTWYELKEYLKDFSKENLVAYINNDYHIVSSLVTSGKTRSIITDGSAYIDTNFTATGGMHAFLNVKVLDTGEFYFGSINLPSNPTNEFNRNHLRIDNSNNVANLMVLDKYGSNKISVANKLNLNKFNNIELSTIPSNIFLNINGTIATSSTSMNLTPTNTVVLFYMRYDGLVSSAGHACAKLIIKNSSDAIQREMYPFVKNGENGMIDVLAGTFYENVNSEGEFTISETNTPLASITSRTRAIIIDKFGYEAWRKVRDYFNDESTANLVPYVNEDPDIVCNLVDIGYTRYIIGDDNAYIDTQYILNSNSKVYAKFKYPLNKSGIALGSRIAYQNNQFIIIQKGSGGNYYIGYGNETFDTAITDNNIHEVEFNKNIAKFDNISHTFTAQTFNTPGNAIIMGNNTNNTISACGIYISKVILDEKEFHPFVRNNVNGMIDILSDTFYPNANSSGAFTISIEQNS